MVSTHLRCICENNKSATACSNTCSFPMVNNKNIKYIIGGKCRGRESIHFGLVRFSSASISNCSIVFMDLLKKCIVNNSYTLFFIITGYFLTEAGTGGIRKEIQVDFFKIETITPTTQFFP